MSTSLRVLIVEDSENDAVLMMRELKRGGYAAQFERVETAGEMKDALARQTWDLILADYNLPRFSAPGVLKVLQQSGSDVPCIVVSGSIGQELAVAILKAGAYDCVLKEDLGRLARATERAVRDAALRKERQQAEEALRESEARFALALQGSRDGIWDWNLVTGRVYYSDSLKELLGVQDTRLVHDIESFRTWIYEDDRERIATAVRDHLERRVRYDVEYRVRTERGEVIWVHGRGQALWDATGKPIRMAGSLSDLTPRKRAEMELQEQLDLIRRQQDAIRILSTPIIEVWDGVLTMPVLGVVDTERATEMIGSLLAAVTRNGSRYVIIDLTGVESMDATAANHVIRLVNAVKIVGAYGIVVGIQPEVARAIVSIGVDLSRIMTLANLREALRWCIGHSERLPRFREYQER